MTSKKLPARWLMRLDATVGSVGHDAANHTLFQVSEAKNGLYTTLFKMMVASLDPLGIPIAVDVVPGNQADDPLYVPVYLVNGHKKRPFTAIGVLLVNAPRRFGRRG